MHAPSIRQVLLAVACLAALAFPTGCGSDDESGAEEAAQAYVDARNENDAEAICELFSDQLREQIAAGGNCVAFIGEQSSGAETDYTLIRVEENGDVAAAAIEARTAEGEAQRDQELEVGLERLDGDWQITSLGPTTAD